MTSQNEPGTAYVLDDDVEVRRSLQRLIETVGLKVVTVGKVEDFWKVFDPAATGCLILDMRLPDTSGLTFLEELRARRIQLPVIMISAYGDVQSAVRAMRANVVDFLEKPFSDEVLLSRVQQAITMDENRRQSEARVDEILACIESLTRRERQVMDLVVDGKANKMVAYDLKIAQKTAEHFRSRVMEKMKAASLAELVQMVMIARAVQAGQSPTAMPPSPVLQGEPKPGA